MTDLRRKGALGGGMRVKIFGWLFWASVAIWGVGTCIGEMQWRVFFNAGGDLFADFFNPVRFSANLDPYFDETLGRMEHLYPPLSYLILYPASVLCRHFGLQLPEAGLAEFWTSFGAMAICVAFTGVSALLLIAGMRKIMRERCDRATAWMLTAAFLVSGMMLYTFERGNLVMLSAAGVAWFLFLERKDDLRSEAPAAFALSVAIALKIYPALFLVLPFWRGRWRLLAMTVGFSAALGLAPLLFFEHTPLENAVRLLGNAREQGAAYFEASPPNLTIAAYVGAAIRGLKMPPELMALVSPIRYGLMLIGALALVGARWMKEDWQRWFLAASGMTLLSNFPGYYTILYFAPAIFAYLSSREEFTRADAFYAAACAVWMTPLQFWLVPARLDGVNPLVSAVLIVTVTVALLGGRFLEMKKGAERR